MPEQRRAAGRRRRGVTLGLGLVAIGMVGFAAGIAPVPRLVWNASASAPVGLYRAVAGEPARGDLVLARTPVSLRALAAERGYLPADVPLIKRVAARAGDTVCAEGDRILINGRHVATRLERDAHGRPLPRWKGCRLLGAAELFLLMAGVPGSFDGRYFGPVRRSAAIARLSPVWLRGGANGRE